MHLPASNRIWLTASWTPYIWRNSITGPVDAENSGPNMRRHLRRLIEDGPKALNETTKCCAPTSRGRRTRPLSGLCDQRRWRTTGHRPRRHLQGHDWPAVTVWITRNLFGYRPACTVKITIWRAGCTSMLNASGTSRRFANDGREGAVIPSLFFDNWACRPPLQLRSGRQLIQALLKNGRVRRDPTGVKS